MLRHASSSILACSNAAASGVTLISFLASAHASVPSLASVERRRVTCDVKRYCGAASSPSWFACANRDPYL